MKSQKRFFIFIIMIFGCKNMPKENPFLNGNSNPQLLAPNIISTNEFHEGIAYFDNKNNIVYFTRSDKKFENSTILSSKYIMGNGWSEPDTLSFSGNNYDAGLSFFPDSQTAFFTSKRDPKDNKLSKEWNIWKTQYKDNAWANPEVLPNPINSDSSECCFTINKEGRAFFSSNRDGSWDIYEIKLSNNKFTDLKKISNNINSNAGEWPGFINNEGNVLIFSSIRKSGVGGDDLYVSKKRDDTWSEPILLDTIINTASYEDSPLITPDGRFLIFSSWKNTNSTTKTSNIYFLKLTENLNRVLKSD